MLFVCSVAWLFLLGCQYQCKWLTGKTRLRNDVLLGTLNPSNSTSFLLLGQHCQSTEWKSSITYASVNLITWKKITRVDGDSYEMNRYFIFHCRSVSLDDRVAELLSLFDGNPKDFPSFATLYFEEPDSTGHSAGPVSDKVSKGRNIALTLM